MSAFTDAVAAFKAAWVAAWSTDPPDKDDIAALGDLHETMALALVFTDLADVPSIYTGKAGYILVVNGTETGLEFAPPSSDSPP